MAKEEELGRPLRAEVGAVPVGRDRGRGSEGDRAEGGDDWQDDQGTSNR